MSGEPGVDVITPVHNGAATLGAAIECVLSQGIDDVRHWIVDDGSTDASAAIAQGFDDPRVNLLRREHAGAAAARNAALECCRGDWVAFLDADDLWSAGKLSRQLAAVAAAPEVGLVCSAAWAFGPELSEQRRLPQRPPGGADTLGDLLRRNFVILSSVLARRDALVAAGGFDERAGLRVGEDYELWLRMADRGTRFLYLDAPLARYRVAPGSATSNPRLVAEQTLGILERWEAAAGATHRRAIAEHRERLHFDLCYQLRARGDLGGACRALARLLPAGLRRGRVWGEAGKLVWRSVRRPASR